jgi:hypothetical protein
MEILMNRKSFALLSALLTISLVPTVGCVGEMEEDSFDLAEEVEADSEALQIGPHDQPSDRVLERREIKRVDQDGNEMQNFVISSTYYAAYTKSATVATANYNVTLYEGDQFTIGTCGINGASNNGDTYLRLFDSSGAEVDSNDDACGGVGSKMVYLATRTGTYQLRAGCYADNSCSGNLAYGFSVPLFNYDKYYTNYALTNTHDMTLTIGSFNTLKIGTCGIPGASGWGNTMLRLYNAGNDLVATNDNACDLLSQLSFSSGSLPPGTYTLRAGCHADNSCAGRVVYHIE